MTSSISKTKKKSAAKNTKDTANDAATSANSRKKARTPVVTKTKAKPKTAAAAKVRRPRPPLVRTQAMRDLSGVAREAVLRYKARQAEEATKPVLSPVKPVVSPIKPIKVQRIGKQPVQAPTKLVLTGKTPPKPGLLAETTAKSISPDTTESKTKRAGLVSNATTFREMNAKFDSAELTRIYDAYYENGERNDDDADVYAMLGFGGLGYVRAPVTEDQFAAFKAANPVIEAQTMWNMYVEEYKTKLAAYQEGLAASQAKIEQYEADLAQYYEDLAAWEESSEDDSLDQPEEPPRPPRPRLYKPEAPPADLDEALERGDYFHVHNTTDHRPAEQDTTGRARRLLVNVSTQKAGLDVAAKLTGLFDDPVVSPYLDHYKIFLTTDTEDEYVKHDKLVVYYEVPPGTKGDTDDIGDRIAAAIEGAVPETEFVDDFAPFYARLAPGIAVAEEPGAHVVDLNDSFTGTRAGIIDEVLNDPDNDEVHGASDFIQLVRAKFREKFVDPDNPYRHLPGNPPEEYLSVRKNPPQPVRTAQVLAATPLVVLPGSVKPSAKNPVQVPVRVGPVDLSESDSDPSFH
jgi:hypothetical protein